MCDSLVGTILYIEEFKKKTVSNKSDLCLWASKQTGSHWSPGSAKQKYIKTMEKGLDQLS